MNPVISFPTEADRLARDLLEFAGASPDARVRALLEMSELCADILRASPTAARQRALIEEREEAENDRWRELLRGCTSHEE